MGDLGLVRGEGMVGPELLGWAHFLVYRVKA